MDELHLASDEADALAAQAMTTHHAAMAGTLALKAEALAAATRAHRPADADEVRAGLVGWCRDELLPHALAEEGTLYRAASERPEARLLVAAMLAEHRVIGELVEQLERASDPVNAAGAAQALRVLFDVHLAKEEEQLVPLLVAAPDVSVASLLGGMHELLGGAAASPHDAGAGCTCGEADPEGYPELDARAIPHAIRHATIFGALDGVRQGAGLVLVAPHDPLPLLAQLERREPGGFDVEYLQRGPDSWRLALVRTTAVGGSR